MTLSPPNRPPQKPPDNPATTLDYEIAQEKAAALGRLGRGLETALAKLAACDAAQSTDIDRDMRVRLVSEAGHALWLFVVQRESIGLRDTRTLMRDYRVPAEVLARMGAFPPR